MSTAGVDVSDALLAGDSLDAQTADLDALLQRLADVSTAMAGAVKGGVGDTRAHTLAILRAASAQAASAQAAAAARLIDRRGEIGARPRLCFLLLRGVG